MRVTIGPLEESAVRIQVQFIYKWSKIQTQSLTWLDLVMWRRRRGIETNETSHIEALYRSLICFAKSTWSITSEASFALKTRDCFIAGSNEANLSAISFTVYYIIMHLHCFLFILMYILRSNELCLWNSSLRTEAELTLTDHKFNSWVYVDLYEWSNEWLWQSQLCLYNKLKQ